MNATVAMVSNSPSLFSGLPEATLAELDAAGKLRISHYEPDQFIFLEGQEKPPGLYLLLEGTVRISRLASSGKETVIRIIRPGEIFAAVSLFGDVPIMPATAAALDNATVLEVERQTLLSLIAKHPEWALSLLGFMSGRMRYLQERLHTMVSERAPNRLAQIILDYARTHGQEADGTLSQPLTYKTLADLGGITYEETVRIMRGWSAAGHIAYGRHGRLRLLKKGNMQAIADGHTP